MQFLLIPDSSEIRRIWGKGEDELNLQFQHLLTNPTKIYKGTEQAYYPVVKTSLVESKSLGLALDSFRKP